MSVEPWYLAGLVLALFGGILSGVPVMLVLLGVPLLVAGLGALTGAFDPVFLQALPQRIWGITGNTLLIAVPLFVAMGVLLERSRSAERMLLVISRGLGGSPTSLALAVLGVAALIAASTGIIGATIVMLGLISLPALLQRGVPVGLSSGLVCAAGTLGQIIPPSIVLILLGDQIANSYLEAQHEAGNFAPEPVSVADLFAGALVPGLLLVLLYALWVAWVLRGRRVMTSAAAFDPAVPAPSPPPLGSVAPAGAGAFWRVFLPPLVLIISVLGSILFGVATPTEAAAVGAAGALLLAAAQLSEVRSVQVSTLAAVAGALSLLALHALVGWLPGPVLLALRLLCCGLLLAGLLVSSVALWRLQVLDDVCRQTVQVSAMVFGIVIGASMLSLVFRGFGGDEVIALWLEGLPGGEYGALAAVMLLVFLLGFVLEFVEIIFIVVPLVGPILLAGSLDPVWVAVLLALNLQTSFLTPPFGFALFYFRSVAPPGFGTWALYRAILPFVVLQVVAMALVIAFPALATWLPAHW